MLKKRMTAKTAIKGQALLEALIAFAVAISIIASVTLAVLSSLKNTQVSKNQNLGTQYAQEGMETLRQLRNANQLPIPVGRKTYCMDENGKLVDEDCTTGTYRREVIIESGASTCSVLPTDEPTQTPVPPLPPFCADGTNDEQYSRFMVGCNAPLATGSVSLDDATDLCGNGAHICSIDEFLSYGGDTRSSTTGRWIGTSTNNGVMNYTCAPPLLVFDTGNSESQSSFVSNSERAAVNTCNQSGYIWRALNNGLKQGTMCCNTTIPPGGASLPTPTPIVIAGLIKTTVSVSWSDNTCPANNEYCQKVSLFSCMSHEDAVPTP